MQVDSEISKKPTQEGCVPSNVGPVALLGE